jgi:hypothetical protein
VLPDLVNRADVRMIHRGGRASLAEETLERPLVTGNVRRKKFQRDGAAERDVLGAIDHAHASAAQLFDDATVGDTLADQRRGLTHLRIILGAAY